MHHLYPSVKGDPLCPLGFHPQVRWPTRCKRCFRDYKEHGGRKKEESPLRRDDVTISSPSLSTWNSTSSRNRDDVSSGGVESSRSWASSTSLSTGKDENVTENDSGDRFGKTPASWTSTPDLANLSSSSQANVVTYNLTLPRRRSQLNDTGQESVTLKKPDTTIKKGDSLAERVKKIQAKAVAAKSETSTNTTPVATPKTSSILASRRSKIEERNKEETNNKHDVQFLIQVKSKTAQNRSNSGLQQHERDDASIADTDTTDTTLVGPDNDLLEQIESLKQELETVKTRCERAEREKSDILLRRLASYETTPNKTTAGEVLKLQQKVNELQTTSEDLADDKKSLSLRVKELEEELENRPTAAEAKRVSDELQAKLTAAETLCEELMDENEDMKKELREMEEEIEEMQDNFREDQANEYTSLKKELEQTSKNCRILSFKLRKAERKAEELETAKQEVEQKLQDVAGSNTLNYVERIKHLEYELKVANEVSLRLQKDLEESNSQLAKVEGKQAGNKKKLGVIGKSASEEGQKVSRASLTRGGSQEDPVQLLRDLQDSLEREADLREQLRFAEEEAQNLRRKSSRIEDDNESLVLQLKKMATKARSRKLSPTPSHLSPESSVDKDEGISDIEDPNELRLLLELNEQEAGVLRRKVEDLEAENDMVNKKVKDLQEKLSSKTTNKSANLATNGKVSAIDEQKIKVLEDEISELRKKLIEKDRDYERLNSELTLIQKQKAKGTISKTKSLDSDQQAVDLKRQLEVIEQEANILHGKVKTLESENEKLMSDNKRLQLISGTKKVSSDKSLNTYIDKIAALETELSETKEKLKSVESQSVVRGGFLNKDSDSKKLKEELEKLKDQVKKMETEKKTLTDKLNDLKDEAFQAKPRTPKKPTDITTKLQMKKMVLDLENEIGEILVLLKTSEDARTRLENALKSKDSTGTSQDLQTTNQDVIELKKKLSETEKVLASEKELNQTKIKEISDFQLKIEELQDSVKQLTTSKEKIEQEHHKLVDERTTLEGKVRKLNSQLKTAETKGSDTDKLSTTIKTLKKDIELKDKEIDKLKRDVEKLQSTELEKSKANKELEEKAKLISNLEKKIQDSDSVLKQKDDELKQKTEEISRLEKAVKSTSTVQFDDKKVSTLEVQVSTLTKELKDAEDKQKQAEATAKTLEESFTSTKSELKNLENKNHQLESELKTMKEQSSKTKINLEKEIKLKESEINKLEAKIKILDQTSGLRTKKINDVKKEYEDQINKLTADLKSEKQEYDDLTAKYEILEEEHVVTKAQLVTEKENLLRQLHESELGLDTVNNELRTLRDTYNTKQDAWIKEKLQMQEKMKQFESNNSMETLTMERNRFKVSFDEKVSELDQIRKEYNVIQDQLSFARKENDELRKKLDDFDKVSKIQRNMSADSTAMEKEIRTLTNRCTNAEKMHKIELNQCKMRYDNQVAVLSEELQSLQDQVTRFKRERDNFKHMLESAQKTMSELKTTGKREHRNSTTSYDEVEESRSKIITLEEQISCMEDELSEARLESSKLKTELVSERSSWEIKMSEMQTRVNELEEERILASGRSKIPGQRTRMELAWQKEREEQQRLLQETSTLARDLRQTLFEVERERDKERLESKRKHDQLKKFVEEEQDESRKKLTEIQCDLLELRDAHAKLRTTNEKLRREKERHEREYDEIRREIVAKRRAEQEEDRKLTSLLQQVEELTKLVPELHGSEKVDESSALLAMTPTAPRRLKGPKSRESSPSLERRSMSREPSPFVDKQMQIQTTLLRLTNATEELRKYQQLNDAERDRERTKRFGMRRAASTETENGGENIRSIPARKNSLAENGSLKRRSLSLEQTSGTRPDQVIWKVDDDSISSLQSLDGRNTSGAARYLKQDSSLDSRLSGGSTQSEIINSSDVRKKKKGLIGKLKNLTKSHSIDDTMEGSRGDVSHHQGSDSDMSMSEDVRSSKKDLKGRITGMFRRAGSSSRSNSLERTRKEPTPDSSSQRPLAKNGSNNALNKIQTKTEDNSASSTSSKSSTLKLKKK